MKTTEVKLAKFSPLANDIAPDTVIEIKDAIPEFRTREQAGMWYETQAKTLAGALRNSLPQGVLERLALVLMENEISVYRGKMRS